MQVQLFQSRIAPSFERAPEGERLYEVITVSGGHRIASTTDRREALELAMRLNQSAEQWADRVGSDAVLG